MTRLLISKPLTAEEWQAWTTAEEQATAAGFTPHRRTEYLSWRAVARRELGAGTEIHYDPCGAPRVDIKGIHIAVSHCRGRIAVAISDAPCGVDIEPADRNFGRAAGRYMTSVERSMASALPHGDGIVWCAKECLYKLAARHELDLQSDIVIDSITTDPDATPTAGEIKGRILDGKAIDLQFSIADGYILVWK